jgi:alkanesulfonate monooxygenase SsuD/methylene tetrahydromethanopterin reductase-like flavin-dependent oxidoreductase (luciferase family)
MYQMRRLASVIGTSGLHAGVSAISHDDRNAQADLLADMSYDDVLRDKVIYGTPEGVVERLRQLEEELELTQIIYEVNFGCLIPYELQFNCLKLMMERVVPEFS